ncbi:polymorphic toxin-type HINT domain-containing protein [Streptomyces lavendulocolor]|uniref:polymorphic toxin-type HINT domain-containing protein n=1 Tax=Streptomyces lavendulocolor TaxID=67316 RepID=UPI003C2EF61C
MKQPPRSSFQWAKTRSERPWTAWARRFGVAALSTSFLIGANTTPVAADDVTAVTVDRWDRSYVVRAWQEGGPGVKEAAEAALTGTDEDILTFLKTEEALAQYHDERIAAGQMASTGGTGVREAARAALSGNQDGLEEFLIEGWQQPQEQDNRVRVGQIMSTGGNGVKDAGKAALQGSPADVRRFLEQGQYQARVTDQRVEVGQIMSVGGPATKAAARLALRGTPQDVAEFIATGQFTARARDGERATIAQLAKQAEQAGRLAKAETDMAVDFAQRAKVASEAAKKAAEVAAAETKAAGRDSVRAANAAARAAEAARGAAAEARKAIGAAQAANSAARIAAGAAAAAASAASKAADAASRALGAAADAASDARKADVARKLAAEARKAADTATQASAAAEQAGKASEAADSAAGAALGAAGNATAAADAAADAGNWAAQAGVNAEEAKEAAARARRHANEADRAASAASSLARKSAAAAYDARDNARSAAQHARNAADAAEEAADHAGDASKAAAQSAKHATGAKSAADTAGKAVATAQKVFELARDAEAAELAQRLAAGMDEAEARRKNREALNAEIAETLKQTYSLDGEAAQLSAEAAQPGADTNALVAKGRALAVKAMKNGDHGPWSQEAATAALSGGDATVLLYLRTGRSEAIARDTRFQVEQLASDSPYQVVRDAAARALQGNDRDVDTFLRHGQHQVAVIEYRVQVAKVHSSGGTGVQEASKALLEENDPKKLAAFLMVDQYTARNTDERVRAGQLLSSGGPEVRAAARIALAGPADELHEFIEYGQHQADSKDQLTATHIAQASQLIAQSARTAADARTESWRAAVAAANAARAYTEADDAAEQAKKSEAQAALHAADARKAAASAETSAAKATESAATARNAAADANRAATSAETSAFRARFSADYARQSATKARRAAADARESAEQAGKSAEAAAADEKAAWSKTEQLLKAELEAAKRQAEAELKKKQQEEEDRRSHTCYQPITERGDYAFLECVKRNGDKAIIEPPQVPGFLKDLALELSGINGILDCLDDPQFKKCTLALAEVIPAGKLLKFRKLQDLGTLAEKVRLRKPKCDSCFPPGTKVLMADGAAKNIERVQPGDQVLATDPISGATSGRPVGRQVITKDDKWFNQLTVTTPRGREQLNPTYEHPFWSPSEQSWVKAADLRKGMTLRTPDGAELVTVEKNRAHAKISTTYNLSVVGVHTYYVLAGTTPVLVHNCFEFDPDVVGNGLPVWNKGDRTKGRFTDSEGKIYEMESGRPPEDRRLLDIVNERLQSQGFKGKAGNADHVELKFAALMWEKGIDEAKIVINYPTGTCRDPLGCDHLLNAVLGNKTLTVYWPDENGGYTSSHTYGNGRKNRGVKGA